jgi:acetylcholinesterase
MDLESALKRSYPLMANASVDQLLDLYPDDPFYGCPFDTGDTLLPSGREDKRGNAIIGDVHMHSGVSGHPAPACYHSSPHAQRRQLAQIISRTNSVYSYRFDQPPDNATITSGTGHFQEVAFVFSNPLPTQNSLSQRPGDAELAAYMTSAWASFVHSQSPNHGRTYLSIMSGRASADPDGVSETGVQWPDYRKGAKNMVFRRHGNFVEDDDYRKAGIALYVF